MEDLKVPGDKPISPFNLEKLKREKEIENETCLRGV